MTPGRFKNCSRSQLTCIDTTALVLQLIDLHFSNPGVTCIRSRRRVCTVLEKMCVLSSCMSRCSRHHSFLSGTFHCMWKSSLMRGLASFHMFASFCTSQGNLQQRDGKIMSSLLNVCLWHVHILYSNSSSIYEKL